MSRSIATYITLFIVLLLAQVLICNRILLFGLAMPVVFIYCIIRLPMSVKVPAVLTIAFLYGSAVDVFSDTAGINALGCTVMAILRKPVYNLYIGHDADMADLTPTVSNLGVFTYIKYMLTLVLVFMTVSYFLIYFSFLHLPDLAGRIFSSAGITAILLLGIDSMIINRRDKKVKTRPPQICDRHLHNASCHIICGETFCFAGL